ncbi:hypothetical protein [Gracilibacillus thailandensis]|uniref:Uncharacterized protein n=1 Tax=Gracilibacillus thailandensis TaxID=563735 RepID=A0A6N7QXN4_9BACI|nr:hypothetical protein [Gracilibacillus thailandensis]MRI66778.1 hypothetical protein [Gracilibacillus thailandensis]
MDKVVIVAFILTILSTSIVLANKEANNVISPLQEDLCKRLLFRGPEWLK